jgi:quercetin dioxygenase-like cupin family protein
MRSAFLALGSAALLLASVPAGHAADESDLNPDAIKIFGADDFQFGAPEATGASSINLFGDRESNEYYVYINRFMPGNFSMPHFHENDRFITVLKGTWWVGTGSDYDPEHNTVPVPVGSFVIHYGGEVHYDGAKDEEVWVLISGVGPSAGTPVEPTN